MDTLGVLRRQPIEITLMFLTARSDLDADNNKFFKKNLHFTLTKHKLIFGFLVGTNDNSAIFESLFKIRWLFHALRRMLGFPVRSLTVLRAISHPLASCASLDKVSLQQNLYWGLLTANWAANFSVFTQCSLLPHQNSCWPRMYFTN